MGESVAAKVQDDAAQKSLPERLAELAQTAEVPLPHPFGCLHLDRDEWAVVAFEHELEVVVEPTIAARAGATTDRKRETPT